jgi:hypothetical protein
MMLELDEEDLDKLAEYLTIKDEQGRAMLKIGWVVRIFFAEPWTKPVREAVSAAAEEYIQMTREHLRWARQPRTGHMHPIGTGRVKFPWEWVPQHDDEEKSWNFGFHGERETRMRAAFSSMRLVARRREADQGILKSICRSPGLPIMLGRFRGSCSTSPSAFIRSADMERSACRPHKMQMECNARCIW